MMRLLHGFALGAVLALGLIAPAAVQAQEEAAPAAPAAAPPAAPIPYTVLRPAPRRAATPAPRPRVAAPAPASNPAPATVAPIGPADPVLETFVDGLAQDAMAGDHIAGLAVAVVQNGRISLAKGYGFADVASGRRVDGQRTLFRLGSLSKTITWLAILKEVEAGRMRLDAPANIYLPQRLQIRDQGFNQPVRLRDLMDQTSGFEERMLGQLYQDNADRVRPLAIWLRQERPDRVREPGLMTAYSTYGAALAGEAVSQVVGQPFDRVAAQSVLAPAGMWRTTFRQPNAAREGLPTPMDAGLAAELSGGFRWAGGGYQPQAFEFVEASPAGGASSTAADMGRFMRLLLGQGAIDGTTVFGPRTAQGLLTPLFRPVAGAPGWRHGFADYPLPGGRMGYGDTGSTLLFHSSLVIAPELGLGIFVVANTDTASRFVDRLPAAIVERFYGAQASAPPKGDPALYANRGVYEGRYLSTRRAFGGLEGFVIGLFRAGSVVTVTPDGYLTTRGADGVRRWAPVSATRFVGVNGVDTLDFAIEGGRATRILGPIATRERAPLWFDPTVLIALAALVAAAAVAALGAPLFRDRREFRQAQVQARAGAAQTSQSALWLLSFAFFSVWAAGAGDVSALVRDWPGFWLLAASACALVAALLCLPVLFLLPWAWRGGRRVDSWTFGRKLRFTVTALLFAAFSVVLALTGALAPWDA